MPSIDHDPMTAIAADRFFEWLSTTLAGLAEKDKRATVCFIGPAVFDAVVGRYNSWIHRGATVKTATMLFGVQILKSASVVTSSALLLDTEGIAHEL